MNISKFSIDNLFSFYLNLYLFSIPLLLVFVWFWLTYVDRVHIRVKAKDFGLLIKDKLSNTLSPKNIFFVEKYVYKQLNTFGEIIAGFSDGLLNKPSIIDIKYITNADSQTLVSNFNLIENQTQTLPLKISDAQTNTDISEYYNEKEINKNTIEEKLSTSIAVKKIFKISKNERRLDTEMLEKDLQEDQKQNINPQNKRITIKKRE